MGRVLVVEDSRDMRDMLAIALEESGMEVTTAADGRAALGELCRSQEQERPFDVMLLDISMPFIDGWEVLAAVRAHPVWRHLPVIALTGQATRPVDRSRLRGLDAVYSDKGPGFLDFVVAMTERLMPGARYATP